MSLSFNSRYAGKIHHRTRHRRATRYWVSIPAMRVRYIHGDSLQKQVFAVSIPAMRVRYIYQSKVVISPVKVSIPAMRVRYICRY